MTESTPTRRKLGSIEIERLTVGESPRRYTYQLLYPDGSVLYSMTAGEHLYAAAEQFEALQALRKRVETITDMEVDGEVRVTLYGGETAKLPATLFMAWLKEAILNPKPPTVALGALGKEESDG